MRNHNRRIDRRQLLASEQQPATVCDNTLDIVDFKSDGELLDYDLFNPRQWEIFDDFYFDDPDDGGSV